MKPPYGRVAQVLLGALGGVLGIVVAITFAAACRGGGPDPESSGAASSGGAAASSGGAAASSGGAAASSGGAAASSGGAAASSGGAATATGETDSAATPTAGTGSTASAPATDPFAALLTLPFPAADGFDLPVGDGEGGGRYTGPDGRAHRGWYVATTFGERYALGVHPGEDWNGRGGGNSDLGQPVRATARGRVAVAGTFPDPWGGLVAVDHLYYENHELRRVRSVYAHLSRIDVKVGEPVGRRQVIGAIGRDPGGRYYAHLHFELRTDLELPPTYWPSSAGRDEAWIRGRYLEPSRFVREHGRCLVPADEAHLVLVHHQSRRMRLYEAGRLAGEWDIGLGQGAGTKRRRGDLKTPKGAYFVVEKHRGAFSGPMGPWYGGHWIKVSYPNPWDAARGEAEGWLDARRRAAIDRDFWRRRLTDQKTRLGGGIGFHGWVGPWDPAEDGTRLSWGCVVMHNGNIKGTYERIPKGSLVILF